MKKKTELRNIFIILIFFVFSVGMIIVGIYIDYYKGGDGLFLSEYNKEIKNELGEILEYQKNTDKKIKDSLNDPSYTFTSPLIIKNPYKINPLSAIIAFHTSESVSIDVYLNDVFLTKTDYDNEHVIPIYGLYANGRNIITLVSSDGAIKNIEILTEPYNDYLYGYNLSANLENGTHMFVLGELITNNIVRGFDYNNNLIYYLDLKNIEGFEIRDYYIYVSYNPRIISNSNLQPLELKIDLLGRIVGTEESYRLRNMLPNLTIESNSYIMQPAYIYQESSSKYIPTTYQESIEETEYKQYKLPYLSKELINASLYDGSYNVVLMGSYLTFEFENLIPDSKLLIVSKDNRVKEYEIDNINLIRVKDLKDSVLYLKQKDNYYNLLLEIKN